MQSIVLNDLHASPHLIFFLGFFFFNVGHLKKLSNGCAGSAAARGLFLIVTSGGYSSLQLSGFSLRWLLCCEAWAPDVLGSADAM